jgi:hypothetical protein
VTHTRRRGLPRIPNARYHAAVGYCCHGILRPQRHKDLPVASGPVCAIRPPLRCTLERWMASVCGRCACRRSQLRAGLSCSSAGSARVSAVLSSTRAWQGNHAYARAHSHARTLTRARTVAHTHTRAHTRAQTRAQTHASTHARPSHARTHARTHSHAHTYRRTHGHVR